SGKIAAMHLSVILCSSYHHRILIDALFQNSAELIHQIRESYRYLASTPTAFAIDEECENPEYIVCVPDGTECANYDCWSYNTIYNVEMCYDERYGKTNQGICYYTYTNTGRRC
ncbi:MAG: hypothetical protein ABI456_23580, partial [Ktedonobacteraceae bacterium]